jgi:hypothetical protein
MTTVLAKIIFRNYNSSLVRQHTVDQSFSCVFTTQIIDSLVPHSDESIRIMRNCGGLKLGSPALDALWTLEPQGFNTALQKIGAKEVCLSGHQK